MAEVMDIKQAPSARGRTAREDAGESRRATPGERLMWEAWQVGAAYIRSRLVYIPDDDPRRPDLEKLADWR
jgi:hypothetical protein